VDVRDQVCSRKKREVSVCALDVIAKNRMTRLFIGRRKADPYDVLSCEKSAGSLQAPRPSGTLITSRFQLGRAGNANGQADLSGHWVSRPFSEWHVAQAGKSRNSRVTRRQHDRLWARKSRPSIYVAASKVDCRVHSTSLKVFAGADEAPQLRGGLGPRTDVRSHVRMVHRSVTRTPASVFQSKRWRPYGFRSGDHAES